MVIRSGASGVICAIRSSASRRPCRSGTSRPSRRSRSSHAGSAPDTAGGSLGVVERPGLGASSVVIGAVTRPARAPTLARLRGERRLVLGVGRPVERRAVLGADIVALAHALGRVMSLPERPEQLVVGDLARVVGDEDDLGVAGTAGARLLIGRVGRRAAGVADGGRVDAGQRPEQRSAPQKQPIPKIAGSIPSGNGGSSGVPSTT